MNSTSNVVNSLRIASWYIHGALPQKHELREIAFKHELDAIVFRETLSIA